MTLSNFIWCILGIVGSFLISKYFDFKSRKKKELVFNINSKKLYSSNWLEGMELYFNEKKYNEVSRTDVLFMNAGIDIINGDDFAKKSRLCLITDGQIIDKDNNKIISQNTCDSNQLSLDFQNDCMYIDFDYIGQKDSFSLTIFHSGDLTVGGTLKNGSMIDYDIKYEEYLIARKKFSKFFNVFVAGSIIASMGFFFFLFFLSFIGANQILDMILEADIEKYLRISLYGFIVGSLGLLFIGTLGVEKFYSKYLNIAEIE